MHHFSSNALAVDCAVWSASALHISSYLMCCTYFVVEKVRGRFRAAQAGRRGGIGLLDGGISPAFPMVFAAVQIK